MEWARGLHGDACFIPPLYCFTTASLIYGKELDLSGREARHDFAVHPRLPLLQQREKMLKLLERERIQLNIYQQLQYLRSCSAFCVSICTFVLVKQVN